MTTTAQEEQSKLSSYEYLRVLHKIATQGHYSHDEQQIVSDATKARHITPSGTSPRITPEGRRFLVEELSALIRDVAGRQLDPVSGLWIKPTAAEVLASDPAPLDVQVVLGEAAVLCTLVEQSGYDLSDLTPNLSQATHEATKTNPRAAQLTAGKTLENFVPRKEPSDVH